MTVFPLSAAKLFADLCFAQPLQIEVENHSDGFCLIFVDNISSVHTVIADDIAAAVQHAVITADFLTGTDTLGNFTAFLLGKGCHDRQPQLTIAVHRPDIILDEIDLYAVVF